MDLVKADGDVGVFFLKDGNVIALRNTGDHIEVTGIKGTVCLFLNDKTQLTLHEHGSLGDPQREESDADPFTLFHLKPPITVIEVATYRDGGTVSFVIVDARGNRLPGGLSRRLMEEQHKFFVGAKFYERSGAELLQVGSSREKALVSILQSWLDQELSADEQEFLANCAEPQQRGSKRENCRLVLQAIRETHLRRLGFSLERSE